MNDKQTTNKRINNKYIHTYIHKQLAGQLSVSTRVIKDPDFSTVATSFFSLHPFPLLSLKPSEAK